jgi:hypothetical protein
MRELEQLLGLFVAAVILASGARRVGAPYPVFLALGGAIVVHAASGAALACRYMTAYRAVVDGDAYSPASGSP